MSIAYQWREATGTAVAMQSAYTEAFARKDALKSATTLEEIEAV